MKKKFFSMFWAMALIAICMFTTAFASANGEQENGIDNTKTTSFSTNDYNVQITTINTPESLTTSDQNPKKQLNLQITNRETKKQEKINVDCYVDMVSNSDLVNVYAKSQEAIADDAKVQNGTYNYVFLDDSNTYFYEQTPNDTDIATMVVTETISKKFSLMSDMLRENADAILAATNEAYARQYITSTGSAGSYLFSTITLPTASQVTTTTASNQNAYIYAGFIGGAGANNKTYSSDMGVTLSNSAGPNANIWGWKPALTLKDQNGNQISTPFVSGYNEVQYRNAYKMGSPVSMYWYYNTGSGTVKMKIIGTAYYATREAVGSETQLTTIMESNSTPAITSISKWKLLTTVTAASCKNYAVFSKVSLNGSPGTAIGSSYFPAAECTSGSTITRTSSGG